MTTTTYPLPLWVDDDPSVDIRQWVRSFLERSEIASAREDSDPGGNGGGVEALYVHVPFCFHKCHYCDFYSIVDAPDTPDTPDAAASVAGQGSDRQSAYTRRLIDELELLAGQIALRPKTVFFGGGTPTLLRTKHWSMLLKRMHELGVLDRVVEFTVEANPETVTGELLEVLVEGGVNRMSIGAQSFDAALLKTLERWHEPVSVSRAVDLARTAGIDNINLDLIFAIPGQSLEQLNSDLDAVLNLEPQHLSCYGLTFEPNTALSQRREMSLVQPIDEDLERDMYERVIDRLCRAGYEHYEISNWARPGRRCEHNLVYWRNGNWLGLGPGAASHVAGRRWKNAPHLGGYLRQPGHPPPICDPEFLSAPGRVGEQLMLGLRLLEGVSWTWLTGVLPANDPRWRVVRQLIDQGLFVSSGENLCLTRQGLFVADAAMEMLI